MANINAPLLPRVFQSSLSLVATNYAYRFDAKYADIEAIQLDTKIRSKSHFQLGDFLPYPFLKGIQPESLDQPTDDSVPVINTLSIQNMSIRVEDCRHIALEDFESLGADRKLRSGDVLLTMDGGVSIGKPVLFDIKGKFTVDSHVSILRPEGLSPLALVYCLASPLGQMQFRRAEAGASGQTNVTEDDIRRFVFPSAILGTLDKVTTDIEAERKAIAVKRKALEAQEAALWKKLGVLSGG